MLPFLTGFLQRHYDLGELEVAWREGDVPAQFRWAVNTVLGMLYGEVIGLLFEDALGSTEDLMPGSHVVEWA